MSISLANDLIAGEGCGGLYPLRGQHVNLRPLESRHVPALVSLAGNEAVSRYTARLPFPYSQQDGLDFLAHARRCNEGGQGRILAIERNPDGAFAGVISVEDVDDRPGTVELGYWLGQDFQGQGLGSEAVRLMVAHAFDDLGHARLVACYWPENMASGRLLEKAGFVPTGSRRISLPARGDYPSRAEVMVSTAELNAAAFAEARKSRLLLVSAIALIDSDNRVLLQQRPADKHMGGLWEFPGGKVESGETPERALIREVREELGIDVRQSCLAPLAFGSHDYGDFHLLMPLYLCRQWRGTPRSAEGQRLAWVRSHDLSSYPMPPADLPLLPLLRDWL